MSFPNKRLAENFTIEPRQFLELLASLIDCKGWTAAHKKEHRMRPLTRLLRGVAAGAIGLLGMSLFAAAAQSEEIRIGYQKSSTLTQLSQLEEKVEQNQ